MTWSSGERRECPAGPRALSSMPRGAVARLLCLQPHDNLCTSAQNQARQQCSHSSRLPPPRVPADRCRRVRCRAHSTAPPSCPCMPAAPPGSAGGRGATLGWSASVARHRELGSWGPQVMAARGCSPTAWQRPRRQQHRKQYDSGSGAAHRLLQHFKHEVRSVAVAEHQHRLGLGCRPEVRLMQRAGREGGSGVSKSAGPLHPQST